MIEELLVIAKRRGLTPTELASQGGLDYSTCHRLLTGKSRRPSFEVVVELAHALDFDVVIRKRTL